MSDIFLKICTMPPRLSELCLDTIVLNFPRHNYAFTTSKDATLKRLLEFLQRKFSYELLVRLYEKDSAIEEFVEFLINKYLRSLDTAWLRNSSWETVLSKIAEIGSSIEEIIFHNVYFDEFGDETPWQDIVCFLPYLKCFTFKDNCNDFILKKVAKFCPDIEYIDIDNSSVTSEAVKSLCRSESGKALCTKLKTLSIAFTSITHEGVKYILKNLKSLENICCSGFPRLLLSLHENDLQSLDKVEPYNFTSLDLSYYVHDSSFVDLLKVCLTVCPHLESLTIKLTYECELAIIPVLPKLEYLDIENRVPLNIDSVIESNGNNLTFLTLTNCFVSVSVLAESCPRIKELVMKYVRILYEEDCKVPVFNLLTSCTFQGIYFNENNFCAFKFIILAPKLEFLHFYNCFLLRTFFQEVFLQTIHSSKVKIISFDSCKIDEQFLKNILKNCNSIKCLKLNDCVNVIQLTELENLAVRLQKNVCIQADSLLDT